MDRHREPDASNRQSQNRSVTPAPPRQKGPRRPRPLARAPKPTDPARSSKLENSSKDVAARHSHFDDGSDCGELDRSERLRTHQNEGDRPDDGNEEPLGVVHVHGLRAGTLSSRRMRRQSRMGRAWSGSRRVKQLMRFPDSSFGGVRRAVPDSEWALPLGSSFRWPGTTTNCPSLGDFVRGEKA